ncbi:MAG: hypothetical protein K2Q14_08845 [Gammaproteobacteria bacterium]|nr:hypothetical protein [Gammaproteobacteria bacterium]
MTSQNKSYSQKSGDAKDKGNKYQENNPRMGDDIKNDPPAIELGDHSRSSAGRGANSNQNQHNVHRTNQPKNGDASDKNRSKDDSSSHQKNSTDFKRQ